MKSDDVNEFGQEKGLVGGFCEQGNETVRYSIKVEGIVTSSTHLPAPIRRQSAPQSVRPAICHSYHLPLPL
jgi:hypothetical protein